MLYHKLSDEELTALLRDGDERALRAIYDRYLRQLHYYIVRLAKSKELAEDVVQDVFVKVWEKRAELDQGKSLRSFLFTVAKRNLLNLIKRAQHERYILEQLTYHQPEEDVPFSYEQGRAIFTAAVEQLPAQCREVFVRCNMQGLSYRQTAEELGISEGTVNSQMVKAIRSIKQYISLRSALALVSIWFVS